MPPRAALAAALLAFAAPAWPQSPHSPCATLDSCLALVGAEMSDPERMALHARIRSFGAAAAAALVARLDRPDGRLAQATGLELAQFESLDPRHLPALIRAYEGGNVWMPRAIAATGTDDALTYLQERARRSRDFGSDNQLQMALARFGDRLRPFVAAELEACRRSGPQALCQGIFATLQQIEGGYPAWAADSVAALARAPAAGDSARWLASDFLIRRRDPRGLEILRERLEARSDSPSQIEEALRQSGDYGSAAAGLGPLVASHLDSASADVRAEAAHALGRIGADSEAPGLIALEGRFEDDWLLAYNAAEALGRMRSAAARPLLARTARSHWHRGVRNNAERALESLAGGDFARPGITGDRLPISAAGQGGSLHFPSGEPRYAGDAHPRACPNVQSPTAQAVSQDQPRPMRWPGKGIERLVFEPLRAPAVDALRTRLDQRSARIPFRVPTRSGVLTGYEQGEWGGAVVRLRPDGSSEALFTGNPIGALRMGDRLYILEGLSHMVSSRGSVAILAGDPPGVERRIRLPAKPVEVLATDRRTLIVRTEEGDVAIREDGRLIDPESPAACTKGRR